MVTLTQPSKIKFPIPPPPRQCNNEKITTSIFVGLIESTIRSRLAFILFTSSEIRIVGYVGHRSPPPHPPHRAGGRNGGKKKKQSFRHISRESNRDHSFSFFLSLQLTSLPFFLFVVISFGLPSNFNYISISRTTSSRRLKERERKEKKNSLLVIIPFPLVLLFDNC